jgi:Na+:H+ antiporter, NhaA family
MDINVKLKRVYRPWEQFFRKTIHTPLEAFLHAQTTNGMILMVMTIIALLWINSPLNGVYSHLLHNHITLTIGSFTMDHSVHFWVNDGLMTIFFFQVGLEIKREILVGELSDFKVALLPILAAIGGMLAPALIFKFMTGSLPGSNGWGIPMATDIAFAVSALVLLGKRVSPALVTFLVALAIVDDLGAVSIIALFYTAKIHLLALGIALALFALLIVFNRLGIRAVGIYAIVGLFIWFFTLQSGVHATIAGILVAMSIPSVPKYDPRSGIKPLTELIDGFEQYPPHADMMIDEGQKRIISGIKHQISGIQAPLNKCEDALHLPIGILIIPIFALVNAGIPISMASITDAFSSNVGLGIALGLFGGKVLGIFGVSYLAIKLKIAKLPENSTLNQLFGISFLGGIGFTMSIFIAELAYTNDPKFLLQAKTSILLTSFFAGVVGYLWLRYVAKPQIS